MCVCCIAQPRNGGRDLADVQRLCQMGVHAGCQTFVGILLKRVGCHGNDRDAFCVGAVIGNHGRSKAFGNEILRMLTDE